MPPEPSPWDRKDFFKDRKHERSDSLGSVSRWREAHHVPRELARWGSADFRRPHGKFLVVFALYFLCVYIYIFLFFLFLPLPAR